MVLGKTIPLPQCRYDGISQQYPDILFGNEDWDLDLRMDTPAAVFLRDVPLREFDRVSHLSADEGGECSASRYRPEIAANRVYCCLVAPKSASAADGGITMANRDLYNLQPAIRGL